MNINLFPTKLLHVTMPEYDRDDTLKLLDPYFEQYTAEYSPNGNLEGGARGIHDKFSQLHRQPEFKHIADFIQQHVDQYWLELEYDDVWKPAVHHMWANRYPRGGYATPHSHSPAHMSGVFYVSMEEDMGDIYFKNPNESLLITQPLNSDRRYVNNYSSVKVRSGDLVLFPGWLVHGTLPNNTDNNRVIMAFDVAFKGMNMYHKLAQSL